MRRWRCLALLIAIIALLAGSTLPALTMAASKKPVRLKLPPIAPHRPPHRSIKDVPYDWLQFNGDPQHSGNNRSEAIIGPGNVANLVPLFQVALPDVADGAPVYLANASTVSGTRNLLFVTTRDGTLVTLDADTGEQLWIRQPSSGGCQIVNVTPACFTTASPAIDPNRQFVYSYGLDGYVHKYVVADGTEVIDSA